MFAKLIAKLSLNRLTLPFLTVRKILAPHLGDSMASAIVVVVAVVFVILITFFGMEELCLLTPEMVGCPPTPHGN